MNLAVNIKGEREREGLKETWGGGGGLQNYLIIPLKWGELSLGEGGLLRGNLQGDLRSIERDESRPRDLLVTNTPVNKKGTGSSKENGYGGGGVTLPSKYCVAEILA